MDDLTTEFPIINNRYQIHKTLASGGMAIIYLAQDLLLERNVALKVLRKDFSDNQEFQNSFRAEAKASAKLSHPNIVITYDFGFDADRLYIVMEWIEGTDLKTIISSKKPGMEESLNYLKQAAAGLAYAHQSGFVHCDVKPQNMLVSKKGVLKITDFGIARALDSISRDERYDVVWGSPYYFSPEQAKGLPPSPATDIYSLGIIAYEMFSGKLPFDAEESIELARMHREEEPKPLKKFAPDIPESLNKLVMQAISKEPEKRFKDGAAIRSALENIKLGQSSVAVPSKIKSKKRVAKSKEPEIERKPSQKSDSSPQNEEGFNWVTILLSFLALILGGGLIPFWIYVIFSIR
jgi:eukaryotic-like serine/threonine-protein kinase